MSFAQLMEILLARWKAAAVTLVVIVGVTLLLSFVLPKRYTAEVTVIVDAKGVDPVMGLLVPTQVIPGYLATQVDIIESHRTARAVVEALNLASNPDARAQWTAETGARGAPEDWLAQVLLKNLDVQPAAESNVIEISWTGQNPQFAALVANAFADAYIKTNLELRVDPAKQTAAFFDDQLRQLRSNLEAAQLRLSQYQRDKGFSATDERLDIETARLAELSAQYSVAQAQAVDAWSRQRQLSEFLASGANPATLPDVIGNPLVQTLKAQLVLSESRLEQISSQLGANHPEVQRLKADIEAQRQKLRAEVSAVGASMGNAARIAQRRETELREAVAVQKARMLQINEGRDELAVLLKEVEAAQRAYDAASLRYTQTTLESQASQTNIAVLTRAIPALEPSFPRPVLNAVVAFFLGLFVAVAVALMAEARDRRVRTVADLVDIEGLPVLGHLTRGPRTRGWLRPLRMGARRPAQA
jgi:chain length determinant protein EpsF